MSPQVEPFGQSIGPDASWCCRHKRHNTRVGGQHMMIHQDELGVRIDLGAAGEVEVRAATDHRHEGLEGVLGDGQSYTHPDGCVVTRRGNAWEQWYTPRSAM